MRYVLLEMKHSGSSPKSTLKPTVFWMRYVGLYFLFLVGYTVQRNINFNGRSQHFYFMSQLSKNQCCTDRSWSDLVAVIDIPCYFHDFRPKSRGSIFGQNNMVKSRGSIFGQNNMVCLHGLWQPLYLTRIGQYNFDFLKVRTTSSDPSFLPAH